MAAMPNLKNDLEIFTYVWKITNLKHSILQTGESIESPEFCVPQFKNTKWCLRLYPQGFIKEYKDSISCFLRRVDDNSCSETLEVKYNIYLSSKNNFYLHTKTFKKNNGYGYEEILSHCHKDYDSSQKSLVILFELQLCEKCNCFNVFDFIFSNLTDFDRELTIAEENQTHLCSKRNITFPIKCFAQTKIAYDSFNVQLPISFLKNGPSSKETIPLILPEKYPSLMLDFVLDSENQIDIAIRLADPLIVKSLLITCKLGVVTNKMEEFFNLFEEKHLFTIEKKLETWSLKEKIDQSKYRSPSHDFPMDELKLNMDFVFSFGEFNSEIVKVQYINISPDNVLFKQPIVSNDMFRFYKEKKLCDAVLKVGDKTFHVHKVVLGVASPVFAAMFTNEMTEKETNVVDITDLDEHTFEELISFIYTGSLKELELENAQKLFIAGDKYQIFSLMNLCRNNMISRINCENLFEILAIADNHNDKKLEKQAVKFIKLNKNITLSSPEWDRFSKSNSDFAADILKQVCLLKLRNITL